MTRTVNLVSMLAVIAVPLVGWFVNDWSGGTTLVVYWCETVVTCVFILARIAVHQHWAPRRGHFEYLAPGAGLRSGRTSSLFAGFAISSFAFCAAHGIFLAAILFVLDHDGERALADIHWRSVALGCLSVLVFLAANFLVDLLSLRRWSFLQLEQTARGGLGRVIVVHLTIVFGLIAVAVTGAPDSFFGVFVVVKSLFSLAAALPQSESATAPRRLGAVLNRLSNVRPGPRWEDLWADEIARRETNERPWVGARH